MSEKSLNRVPCYMSFDQSTRSVTLRHAKTNMILMKIKLESGAEGTMTRIDPNGQYDCDNYWMGVKPADSVVFEDGLFGRKKLIVNSINFELK